MMVQKNCTNTTITCTTCLVVLSKRLQFWKNWQKWRTPRRNVVGTTDRRGGLFPKYLENVKLGTKNQLSELCDGMAGRTVTGVTDRHRCDGPSQSLQWKSSLWTLRLPAGRTVAGTTGRRRLRNPSLGQISLYVLRDVLTIPALIIKLVG